jgi:hypothetical protein
MSATESFRPWVMTLATVLAAASLAAGLAEFAGRR